MGSVVLERCSRPIPTRRPRGAPKTRALRGNDVILRAPPPECVYPAREIPNPIAECVYPAREIPNRKNNDAMFNQEQ